MTFSDAVKSCKLTHGAYLVEIESENENDFVAGLSSNKDLWIGYASQTKGGQWLWNNSGVDGLYTNWYPREPSFNGHLPYCALIWRENGGSKAWDDVSCHKRKYFVCEAGKF